ncbi:MAG: hypothetical protein PHO10_06335 [Gemmiger sp.]|nr:hypothetical protein [Gemmiger sp.]
MFLHLDRLCFARQRVTGTVYFPGGYQEDTALPMSAYTVDMQTSAGMP